MTFDCSKTVEEYVLLGMEIDTLKKKQQELQDKQDALKVQILDFLDNTNQDGFTTPLGTVYKQVKLYPRIVDHEALGQWAAKFNRFDIFQRRVTASVFEEMYQANGEYPDGMDTYEETKVVIRKR